MTIAIYNNKGGVGKTTIASALIYVALEKGMLVNVVDADKQRNLMQIVSHGEWDGGEIYENGLLQAHISLSMLRSDALNIIDCPPEFSFIENVKDFKIDKWIIPLRGRFSIDGGASVISQLKNFDLLDNAKVTFISNMNINQGKYGRKQFDEALKIGANVYPEPINQNIIFQKAEDSLKYVFEMPYSSQTESVKVLRKFAEEMIR